jgi:cobalt transporter subunit CbtB
MKMTILIQTARSVRSDIAPILGSAALGIVLLFVAGFAQSEALHNSTHDTRHAAGFACH